MLPSGAERTTSRQGESELGARGWRPGAGARRWGPEARPQESRAGLRVGLRVGKFFAYVLIWVWVWL